MGGCVLGGGEGLGGAGGGGGGAMTCMAWQTGCVH